MKLRNFDELIGVAKIYGGRSVAVAGADDEVVLEGLRVAYEEDIVTPILFGHSERITAEMNRMGIDFDWQIEHVDGDDRAIAEAAVDAVKTGQAQMLMKGHMSTSVLFSTVLNRDKGLPRDGILSHIVFVEIPHYHKMVAFTDGGLNVSPDFGHKVEITRNAIAAFHRLGYKCPKVGLLSYVETVNKNDPETSDWQKLVEMAKDGEFGDALVEGPLAMDLCLSKKAKAIKEYKGDVAGDADIVIAPNITACNASAKALILDGGVGGGVLIGTSAPIIALSRGDTSRTRLCSIAVASALLGRDRSE